MKSTLTFGIDADIKSAGLDLGTFSLSAAKATKVAFGDANLGFTFTIEGEGLKVKNGEIVKGTMDTWTISKDGEALITVKNFELDARDLSHASLQSFFGEGTEIITSAANRVVGSLASDILSAGGGKDIIFGGLGNDKLSGGRGNDVLIGGGDSDTFLFKQGDGKDVVRDFDAIGGTDHQDLIGAAFDEVVIRSKHGNAVIDFGGGDTMTLLHVKASDITDSDFAFL